MRLGQEWKFLGIEELPAEDVQRALDEIFKQTADEVLSNKDISIPASEDTALVGQEAIIVKEDISEGKTRAEDLLSIAKFDVDGNVILLTQETVDALISPIIIEPKLPRPIFKTGQKGNRDCNKPSVVNGLANPHQRSAAEEAYIAFHGKLPAEITEINRTPARQPARIPAGQEKKL